MKSEILKQRWWFYITGLPVKLHHFC